MLALSAGEDDERLARLGGLQQQPGGGDVHATIVDDGLGGRAGSGFVRPLGPIPSLEISRNSGDRLSSRAELATAGRLRVDA